MRIAFLGLGHMGQPMARHLLERKHTLTVYNRTPGRAKALTAIGAIEALSVAEAVKQAEVAITLLSDDTAVADVVHGPSGLIQNLPAKSIHLCMSTIGVETSAALAMAHAQEGQGYVAAPVFGNAEGAETRNIWIVAGGPEPQVNRCRPIFEALGQGYTRVGHNAALAHALKLGGNMISMAMELAVSEILIYAKKAGLPPADYLRFLNTAIFRSHMVGGYGSAASRPSFDPEDQTLDLAANELLMVKAKDLGVAIPVEDLLNARVQAATSRGWGEQDIKELVQACEQATKEEAGQGQETAPSVPPLQVPPSLEQVQPEPDPAAIRIEAPPPPPLIPPVIPRPIPPVVIEPPRPRPPAPEPVSVPGPASLPQADPIPESSTNQEPRRPSILGPEAISASGTTLPARVDAINVYRAKSDGLEVQLDLEDTSHFEWIKGQVWAWYQGRRFQTNWTTFDEVELAFSQVLFLRVRRHILLRPAAVLELRSTFGGGAKARVTENLELKIGRRAAMKLRELIGM